MCDYRIKYGDPKTNETKTYKCPHPKLNIKGEDGKHYCIFHSRDPKKELDQFKKEFGMLFESGKHEFVGFIFPEGFRFQELKKEEDRLIFIDANFTLAEFYCEAAFFNAQFSGEEGTYFSGAKFSGERGTDFTVAQFSSKRGTNFSEAQFSGKGETDFFFAQFSGAGLTSFNGAQFSSKGKTSFFMTQFSGGGGTKFKRAQFSSKGGTDFRHAQFSGEGGAYFTEAQFSGEGKIEFRGKTFAGNDPVEFRYVGVEKPENLTFNNVDLNRVRFLGTDLRNINFHEIYWTNREYGSIRHIKPCMVYDDTFQCGIFQNTLRWIINKFENSKSRIEKWIVRKLKKLKNNKENIHYDVFRLYTQLRMNYEATGRYHEAGDFFIGEMEMRRKGSFESPIIRFILTFYKLFSYYGERPFRAFLFLISVPLVFSMFYLLTGGLEVAESLTNTIYTINYDLAFHFPFFTCEFWKHYTDALMYALKVMAMGKTDCEVMATGKPIFYLSALQIVLSLMFLSLFLLAMNRKFRRMKD